MKTYFCDTCGFGADHPSSKCSMHCEVSADDRLHQQIEILRAALKKAKPIVGAAAASGSNESRPLREKVYQQIEEALKYGE